MQDVFKLLYGGGDRTLPSPSRLLRVLKEFSVLGHNPGRIVLFYDTFLICWNSRIGINKREIGIEEPLD